MKKLTPSQKAHLLARSRDEAGKAKRIGKQRIPIPVNSVYVNDRRTKRNRERRQFNAHPPAVFNLQYENCQKVIEYVNSIKVAAAHKWEIIVDLSRVNNIR